MEFVCWFSAVAAIYAYTVFPGALWLASVVVRRRGRGVGVADQPSRDVAPFSIIVAAHNEAKNIVRKIEELIPALALDPKNELIVVSDHSSDGTIVAAKSVVHPQIRVLDNAGIRGKAGATNHAVPCAENECLVFSDVETRVPTETITKMVEMLGRPHVGCVNAQIAFANESDDKVADAAGLYWRFEMWLRTVETNLDLYATSSGPCMAIRRSLFKELPSTGDVDFTTPLDVIEAGYACVHMADCPAFDVMPQGADVEFRVRVRMVAKNFSGTIARWGWRNILRRPLYTWALYSHKIMRWLTPFFLLCALATNLLLIGRSWIYDATLALQLVVCAAAIAGWIAYRYNKAWPIVPQVYAFVLANVAFFIGVLKSVRGGAPAFYVPTRQLQNLQNK
jgi:cellulose synthase/poly-beta-1,6-N-acetylglucosamine synthase-like glycosyltransferase